MKGLIINNDLIERVQIDLSRSIKKDISEFLKDSEYPGISMWLNKVFNEIELNLSSREIIIILNNKYEMQIDGLTILKKNADEYKICTFLIKEGKRSNGYGSILMKESLEWLSNNNPSISVPLTKVKDMSGLLKKFNFKLSKFSVINGTDDRLEAFYNNQVGTNILMSIKTEYANEIFCGNKKVEFRKRFCTKFNSAVVYSSGVDRKLIGYFTPDKIELLSPREIWKKYGWCGGISESKFNHYYESSEIGLAIIIKNFYKFPEKLSPNVFFGGKFNPPQNYMYL